MAGIPARVVTGYKADLANSVENYLIVKERDAHAWAELLIDHRWRRIETTAFASKISAETRDLLLRGDSGQKGESLLEQINLYLMYIKYQTETWILHYSHFRQMQLLDEVKRDPAFLYKFIAAIVVFLLLALLTIRYLRRPLCQDPVLCMMRPLLEALRKRGCLKEEGETMHSFLSRCREGNLESKEIGRIDALYEHIRYGGDRSEEELRRLKEAIRHFLKK
jgi:hypothetical protein